MEQSEFPGLAAHRAEHHRMLAEMIQSAHCLQYGDAPQMRQLLCALRDGYVEHIADLDSAYGPWLNARGVF
jgi:hemerythrin